MTVYLELIYPVHNVRPGDPRERRSREVRTDLFSSCSHKDL